MNHAVNKKETMRLLGLAMAASLVACDPVPDPTDPTLSTSANENVLTGEGAYVDTPTRTGVNDDHSVIVELQPRSGSEVAGTLRFEQDESLLRIHGELTGLSAGMHGFHIHETGDCTAPDASSAGAHFAPGESRHGAPTAPRSERHGGDLGNIVADPSGVATIDVFSETLSLDGSDNIIERAIVVHADRDDLSSQPSGDAGERVACGVIGGSSSHIS